MPKFRPVIIIEGTPIAVRIVPHNTDPTKLMLKTGHPEAGMALAAICEVEAGELTKGSNFFMVPVDKDEFWKGLVKGFQNIMENQPKQLAEGVCEDCGCNGGTHWNFCGEEKKENLN